MNVKDGVGKYFIALVPPSPVFEQVLALKNYFRDHYQSKGALNSPPHVTLHMPFEWKLKKEDDLCTSLSGFAKTQREFQLKLSGFSSFPPRVIFIRVIENELLNGLQKQLHKFCKVELNLFNAQYRDQPFRAHLTVAFRDLKRAAFVRAWSEFKDKEFEAEFAVRQISLLKHDGKCWQPFRDFLLA